MKCGFVIPVYNHGSTLESVVRQLSVYGLPIIIVDDGNNEENKAYIRKTAETYNLTVPVVRAKNGGKGLALHDGVMKAHEMGLTHILQIDSDGQHDAGRAAFFLKQAEEHPEAVICGYPEYDSSAPVKRMKGRKFANGWVHIVTLSTEIKDAMIGFRVYPVEAYCKILKGHAIIDSRMGYDIDILVHFSWAGVPIISQSVKVTYPENGISNFNMIRDNLRIALTYSRLVIGMIFRLPVLVYRAVKRSI